LALTALGEAAPRFLDHPDGYPAVTAGEDIEQDIMFAVIKTGGKQYKVAKNDVILVEKLDVEAGADVSLDQVLMVGDDASTKIGSPMLKGASVSAKVLDQAQTDKVA